LAFYLPQYHQIAENDEWWGEGFTDWRNVEAARPLFSHHVQPRVPGELGAYDLSDPEVLRRQAALASEYGVDGFVIHHYWFNGRRLLERPVDNLLANDTIDLPFALCWANENWTRRWDGLESDVLIEQTFPDGWADRFFADLLPALTDRRYIRVGGAPLLVLYRTGLIPDAAAVISRWKHLAEAEGLGGLHVLAVIPSRDFEGLPADVEAVIDGLVRFPPGSGIGLQSLATLAPHYDQGNAGDVLSYRAAATEADLSSHRASGLRLHPGVMPGWDNTARRGEAAYAFHGSNPATFRSWLGAAARAAAMSGDEPLLFVNAWNEWAESAYLEPDGRFGRGNLEAIRDAVPMTSLPTPATPSTGDTTSTAAMWSGNE
jgi:lipopolysaccharide biosynthesis protein